LLLFCDSPVGSGTLNPNERLTSGSVEDLERLWIDGREARRWGGQARASWIDAADASLAFESGLFVWGLDQYLALHLADVLRRDPTWMCGVREMYRLMLMRLQPHEFPNSLVMVKLFTVLRALASEGVPLTDFVSIVRRFRKLTEAPSRASVEPDQIIRQLRLMPKLRAELPGNDPCPLYRLSPVMEQRLLQHLVESQSRLFLTPPPELVAQLRSEARRTVAPTRRAALLVEDGRLRPLIRSVLERDFPFLFTISSEELLSSRASSVKGQVAP
jgi:flagellar biosynthesis component FlhA